MLVYFARNIVQGHVDQVHPMKACIILVKQAPITTYIGMTRLTNESEIPNFSLSSAGIEA